MSDNLLVLILSLAGIGAGVLIARSLFRAIDNIVKRSIEFKQRKLELSSGGGNLGKDARLEACEDRIAVLEQIVTDKSYDVSRQIEALRDREPGVKLGEKQ